MPEVKSFHEDLGREHEIDGTSNRSFGITVGAVLLLLAGGRAFLAHLGWFEIALLVIGALLVTLGLTAPGILAPFNKAWTKLGLVLSRIVNPLVMGLIFVTTVTPIGVFMRLARRDPLRLRFDSETPSYWIERKPPGPAPETMKQQF